MTERGPDLEIIATVSAKRAGRHWITGLAGAGATYFRINGAFESIETIRRMVKTIQKGWTKGRAPIWLDVPRNKIRIAADRPRSTFKMGQAIRLGLGDVNFPAFFRPLHRGDVLYAKDSTYRFTVERRTESSAVLRAEQDGAIAPGMGLHRKGGWDKLPLMTLRDLELVELARQYDVPYLGISYLRHSSEIDEIRKVVGPRIKPIFKIETWHAYNELPKILGQLDTISIDRGDLSSEIGIENIHTAVRRIMRSAHRRKIKIFLATQFLSNMIRNPLPSISEVTSLHEAFEDGVHGIQLSEETAAGLFPIASVHWLRSLFAAWGRRSTGRLGSIPLRSHALDRQR